MATDSSQLRELAQLYGVQLAFRDAWGTEREASTEALLGVLKALGVDLPGPESAGEAIRTKQHEVWHWTAEPVIVAWDGAGANVAIRLPAGASEALDCSLTMENGGVRNWRQAIDNLPIADRLQLASSDYVARHLPLDSLPLGYHRLHLSCPGFEAEVLVIGAPRQAHGPSASSGRIGGFLPLYALRTDQSWSSGSFTDLSAFSAWLASQGAGFVATLPLLPAFLEQPYDPSPYSPVSRLFWNEFYIDSRRDPSYATCSEASDLIESPAGRSLIEGLRSTPFVDYRRQWQLQKQVLSALSSHASATSAWSEVEQYAETHPLTQEYARFRALQEAQPGPWTTWPQAAASSDPSPETTRLYLYAQWLASRQLQEVKGATGRSDSGLYLDLPLGVHPDGFDTWYFRDIFASGAAAGAPSDPGFPGGQNWGLPPVNPESQRQSHYDYFIRLIRHQLEFASILRLDHVMGLHRLFWIPRGMDAADGVYVRYPADELYAIICLESARHNAVIVGENLGTVPEYVNEAMALHGIFECYVLQYELLSEGDGSVRPALRGALASLNTHDMVPFAGFMTGRDAELRRDAGLVTPEFADAELQAREQQRHSLFASLRQRGMSPSNDADAAELAKAGTDLLLAGDARFVLVNIEDTWAETEPQNLPGTADIPPNWSRRAAHPLADFPNLDLPGERPPEA